LSFSNFSNTFLTILNS